MLRTLRLSHLILDPAIPVNEWSVIPTPFPNCLLLDLVGDVDHPGQLARLRARLKMERKELPHANPLESMKLSKSSSTASSNFLIKRMCEECTEHHVNRIVQISCAGGPSRGI